LGDRVSSRCGEGAEEARPRRRRADHQDAGNPHRPGAPLKGAHDGFWRWRIGDYRVVARIEDARIMILVVRVAHRREVYR
jgi:mRNA-degrading endonuclease RelE of RelBE toxin-antitoxin system